jgi:hypothetical protein
MYGKIIDGKLVSAPNPLKSGNYKIYNPKPKHYEAEGYLEVIETDYPDTDKYYEKHYVERNGKIYGEWEEIEAPDVPEHIPTAEERITVLEGEVDDLGEALDMILEGVTE